MRKKTGKRDSLREKTMHLIKRINERHINRTTVAMLLILPYLVSEWSARAFNLYISHPFIDNIVHACFGIAFASLLYLVYNKSSNFVIIWSFIISILWEILEITGDIYVPVTAVLQDPFFYDGIKDIMVTFLSAVIAVLLIKRIAKRHYFRIQID